MAYAVKEVFYTLQREGRNAGRAAVFCRFAGCNLWSEREVDRAGAACTFCDTDFDGMDGTLGGRYPDTTALADAVDRAWTGRNSPDRRLVVLTGGEPLLQVDAPLLTALHQHGVEVAVETDGTIAPPDGIDWLCFSPKGTAALAATTGDELKLVYPQPAAMPERFEHLAFGHLLLQPLDGPEVACNTAAAVEYCIANPAWRLSTQTHKHLGIG